jgi:hypothetical protein
LGTAAGAVAVGGGVAVADVREEQPMSNAAAKSSVPAWRILVIRVW